MKKAPAFAHLQQSEIANDNCFTLYELMASLKHDTAIFFIACFQACRHKIAHHIVVALIGKLVLVDER